MQQTAEDLLNTHRTINAEIEKRIGLQKASAVAVNETPQIQSEADAHNANADAIKVETIALEQRNEALKEGNTLKAQEDAIDHSDVANTGLAAGTDVGKEEITAEMQQLEKLKATLTEVKQAVQSKTKAFVDEGTMVGQVVGKEISALKHLSDLLENIQNIVSQINAMEIEVKAGNLESIINTAIGGKISANENPHYITDPYGNKVTMYRGISNNYSGLVSNRYHGGTFFTDDIELARQYAGPRGKIESATLDMKNPFEIDGKHRNWNEIEYLGHSADEASRQIIEFKNTLDHLNKLVKVTDWQNINLVREEDFDRFEQEVTDRASTAWGEDLKAWYLGVIEDARVARQGYLNISNDDSNMYGTHDTNKFVELAKSNGYDGVIFKNVYDGLDKASNLFVALQNEQIRYIETFRTILMHIRSLIISALLTINLMIQ
jgi:hypothetical protein